MSTPNGLNPTFEIVNTTDGFSVNGTIVIDENGNIDAPITVSSEVITSTATTGTASSVTANSLTSGLGLTVASSATALTGAGRLFYSNHSGATSTSGTLNELVTSANDETILLKLTASSLTTGTVLAATGLDALTSGIGVSVSSAATAITGAGRLVYSNHSGATTTSGTLNEFVTSANDETILFKLTGNSLTTGSLLTASATGLSSGKIASLTASSSSTDGGTSFEPVTLATTMTGVGGVGGRLKSSLTTNVALGAWSNALKGEVTYGASGKTTGLGSAIVGEMTLSAGTADGNYALFEGELNLGAGALTGTATSLLYLSVNQTGGNTAFDDSGYVLNVQGLTANAADCFRTGLTAATINAATTAALRIRVGATNYFIPLATATA